MLGTNISYGQMMRQMNKEDAMASRDAFIKYITRKPNHKPKRKR